ncbi:hypothetical protein C8J57DRAFT_1539293 [Mycena rebaudengoi]|nr:hypothetical protein C8J57DRAFT_1539293 [Mycena rebaudengoi]
MESPPLDTPLLLPTPHSDINSSSIVPSYPYGCRLRRNIVDARTRTPLAFVDTREPNGPPLTLEHRHYIEPPVGKRMLPMLDGTRLDSTPMLRSPSPPPPNFGLNMRRVGCVLALRVQACGEPDAAVQSLPSRWRKRHLACRAHCGWVKAVEFAQRRTARLCVKRGTKNLRTAIRKKYESGMNTHLVLLNCVVRNVALSHHRHTCLCCAKKKVELGWARRMHNRPDSDCAFADICRST